MPTTRSKNKKSLYKNTLEDSTTTSSEESEVEEKPKKPRKKIICQKFTDLFTKKMLLMRCTRRKIIRLYCYFVVGQQYTFDKLKTLDQFKLEIKTTPQDKVKLSTSIIKDPETLASRWNDFINYFVTDEATKNKFARVLSPPTAKDMIDWEKANNTNQIYRDSKRQVSERDGAHIHYDLEVKQSHEIVSDGGTANAQQPRKYLAIQNILNEETGDQYRDVIQFISDAPQSLPPSYKNLQTLREMFTPKYLALQGIRMGIIRIYYCFAVKEKYSLDKLEKITPKELHKRTNDTDKGRLLRLINDDPETLKSDWTNFINHFVTDEATKKQFERVLSPPTEKDMTNWKNSNNKNQIYRDKKRQAPQEDYGSHIQKALKTIHTLAFNNDHPQQPTQYLQNLIGQIDADNDDFLMQIVDADVLETTSQPDILSTFTINSALNCNPPISNPQTVLPKTKKLQPLNQFQSLNQPQTLMQLFTPEYLSSPYTRMRLIRLYCYFVVGQQYSLADLETLTPKELHIKTNDTDKDKLSKLINNDPGKLTSDWANFINHFVTDEANKNRFTRVLSPPTVKDMELWINSNARSNAFKRKIKITTVDSHSDPQWQKINSSINSQSILLNSNNTPTTSNDSPQLPTSSGSLFTMFSSTLQRGNIPKRPSGKPSTPNPFKK